jgi:NAD(P)H-hydrate epimerase
MREVDRTMIEDIHIGLPQMMENAGRNLADLAVALFGPSTVTVLAGPGGNGGGGLVAARHLANRGVEVAVALSHPVEEMTPVPAHQFDIVTRMGIPAGEPEPAALIIDALIGYSLQGDPRGRPAELIEWANNQLAPILALDTPSGLDVTTGVSGALCMRAAATMTLALPKSGLYEAAEVGRLYLADISVPPLVYERMGLSVGCLFREGPLLEVGP